MKIFILSLNSPAPEEFDQAVSLRDLWELSDHTHTLVESPQEAGICMACNISGPNWFQGLRTNVVINSFPQKCFAIHDGDIAMPLLHGVYTSAIKSMRRFRRIRGGAYNLFPKSTRNPILDECDGKAYLHPKDKLASFWGQESSAVRKKLFQMQKQPGVEVMNTTGIFTAFGNSTNRENEYHKKYVDQLVCSKFVLCPRGVSPSSIRLFETMKMGIAPVIISNACLLPSGPDWASFALFLDESKLDDLPALLARHEDSFAARGQLARAAYETFFSDDVYFNYLVDQMIGIREEQIIPERCFWMLRNLQVKIFEKNEVQLKNWKC